ncbi:DUF6894 family protein [Rhizobium sp. YTUHZ045]|uniref:DUF6894 family protein n=1 Tax=Rhizobium sp. YTUHZ045 TaxID=2962888 RepID=UPI003DA86127
MTLRHRCTLPTYYFHIRHADYVIRDHEGRDFVDREAAREEAVDDLWELLIHALLRRGQDIPLGIDIYDEDGALAAQVNVDASIPDLVRRLP